MKNGKRILGKIRIRHIEDESPDVSYIGNWTNEPENEFSLKGDDGRWFNPQSVETFNPKAEWIPVKVKDKEAYWRKTMEENARADYRRMRQFEAGEFIFLGIRAECDIAVPNGEQSATVQHIRSGGLWGIESDSDATYLKEIESEQLAELKTQLTALGFSKRAISKAFQSVERKEA